MPVRVMSIVITGTKPDPNAPPTPPVVGRQAIVAVPPGYNQANDAFTVALAPLVNATDLRPTQVIVYATTPDKAPTDPANNNPTWWDAQGFPTSSFGIPETGDPGTITLIPPGIAVGGVYGQFVLEYAS
ncbi:MAG: hypothetical protein KGL39_24895 [Patescibacteria group bacterium]|nr:hypothetical protein [Patescibacteria group bacterium]